MRIMLLGYLALVTMLALTNAASIAFKCDSDTTQIVTPWMYLDGTTCGDLIGQLPDFYNITYRRECQRWLGLSQLPHSVDNAYIDECVKLPNGTTRFRAKVCCTGTVGTPGTATTDKCFACNNVTAPYDSTTGKYVAEVCNHRGSVDSCAAGQTCASIIRSYKSYVRTVTKSCMAKDACQKLIANNRNTCKERIPSPACAYCCSGNFCNYKTSLPYLRPGSVCSPNPCYYYGVCHVNATNPQGYNCTCKSGSTGPRCLTLPCSKGPCKNRAQCFNRYNQTSQSWGYECYCRPGWQGRNCTSGYGKCERNVCLNGGTCFNHTNKGFHRCVCPTGYLGDRCEITPSKKCYTDRLFYKYTGTYGRSSGGYNCTRFSDQFNKNSVNLLGSCLYHMGGKYIDKTSYYGIARTASRLQSCEAGNRYIWYKVSTCCPACFSSPCLNGGRCVPRGADNEDYACKCRFGYEGKHCESKVASCFASGDPHYRTFDQQMIHFQGVCKYNLASPSSAVPGMPPFKVLTKNEYRNGNTKFSYVKYVEIIIFGYTIRIGRNKEVLVNGVRKYPNVIYPNLFSIMNNGLFVRFETDSAATNLSLVVESDGKWTAFVKVPPQYAGKMGGICGDYNGNKANDLRLANGTDVSSSPQKYSLVGNSMQVSDPEDASCTGTAQDDPPACKPETETLVKTAAFCGLLQDKNGAFKACMAGGAVSTADYFESCRFDVCANQDNKTAAKEAACGTLEAVASECASQGAVVDWRSTASCPLTCPVGMVYKARTTACPATCANPNAPKECHLPDTENCACPAGKILKKGVCVSPGDCGCSDKAGNTYDVGTSWLSDDCTENFTCSFCSGCTVPAIMATNYTCADGEKCGTQSGSPACIVDDPCRSHSCRNGATCVRVGSTSSYTCRCLRDYTGKYCETKIDPCQSKPCFNGATCERLSRDKYTCTCAVGYSGILCREVDGGWGPWADWSECTPECTNRKQSRSRSCNSPAPSSGGKPCQGESTQTRKCVCGPFNAQTDCQKCKMTSNIAGYLEDPCHCKFYYSCVRNAQGVWTAYRQGCPDCTRWDQNVLTCVRTSFDCKVTTPKPTTTTTSKPAPEGECTWNGMRKRRGSTPTTYMWQVTDTVSYEMPCAPTLEFDFDQCDCVPGLPRPKDNTKLFCISFDKDFSTTSGTWIDPRNVQRVNGGFKGMAASFSGNGKIEIPFFNNMLDSYPDFSVSLFYKRTGGATGIQGLVSNGNCQGKSSVEIRSQSQTRAGAGVRTDKGDYLNAYTNAPASHDTWHHLVLSFKDKDVSFFVDKIKQTPSVTTSGGKLVRRQCPLVLGTRYSGSTAQYFTGLMDEVCFFRKGMTAQEVTDLYNSYQ